MKEAFKDWSSILFSLLTFLVGSGVETVITGMAFEAGYYETLHIPSSIVNYDRWHHVFFGWSILLKQNLWLVIGWIIVVGLLGSIVFMYLWITLWNFMGSVALKLFKKHSNPKEDPSEVEYRGNSTKEHGGTKEKPSEVESQENFTKEHGGTKEKPFEVESRGNSTKERGGAKEKPSEVESQENFTKEHGGTKEIGKTLLFLISLVVLWGGLVYWWVWTPLRAYQFGQNIANRQLQEPEAHFDKVRLFCGQGQVGRDTSKEYYLLLATSKYSVLAPLDDLHHLIAIDPASLGCFMEIIIKYTPTPASTPTPSPGYFLPTPVGCGNQGADS